MRVNYIPETNINEFSDLVVRYNKWSEDALCDYLELLESLMSDQPSTEVLLSTLPAKMSDQVLKHLQFTEWNRIREEEREIEVSALRASEEVSALRASEEVSALRASEEVSALRASEEVSALRASEEVSALRASEEVSALTTSELVDTAIPLSTSGDKVSGGKCLTGSALSLSLSLPLMSYEVTSLPLLKHSLREEEKDHCVVLKEKSEKFSLREEDKEAKEHSVLVKRLFEPKEKESEKDSLREEDKEVKTLIAPQPILISPTEEPSWYSITDHFAYDWVKLTWFPNKGVAFAPKAAHKGAKIKLHAHATKPFQDKDSDLILFARIHPGFDPDPRGLVWDLERGRRYARIKQLFDAGNITHCGRFDNHKDIHANMEDLVVGFDANNNTAILVWLETLMVIPMNHLTQSVPSSPAAHGYISNATTNSVQLP